MTKLNRRTFLKGAGTVAVYTGARILLPFPLSFLLSQQEKIGSTLTWIVYNDSTKQIEAKQQSPAATVPKQHAGFTAVVISDSDFGNVFVEHSRVDVWDSINKTFTTREMTQDELNAGLNT